MAQLGIDLMYLGQTGRGQTLDSTPGNAATDSKITAKVTLKPEMAVPPQRDKNYPVPQFPCLGGLLSFHILALAASTANSAQVLLKDKGPKVPSRCPPAGPAAVTPRLGSAGCRSSMC